MRIRMRTPLITENRTYWKGEELEWKDDEAKRLIEKGYAEPVNKPEIKRQ